jgi:hypothetical protein
MDTIRLNGRESKLKTGYNSLLTGQDLKDGRNQKAFQAESRPDTCLPDLPEREETGKEPVQ